LSTSPILLIAEREFRTYVATASFWLSLVLAPLMAGAAVFLSGGQQPPTAIRIESGDRQLTQSANLALQEAGRLEGRSFTLEQGKDQEKASVILSKRTAQALDITFSDGFPLSAVGRAMIGHMIERDMARDQVRTAPFAVHENAVAKGQDVAMLSRLVTMIMLWLTLTGSLGMLLQAVVRERANRALESLLAAAQAWEIVTGKMLGVGAVSLMILTVWLGSAAAFSLFAPPEAGLASTILAKLAEPLTLMRDVLIYICAFAFYGSATVGLGALARDSAAAQNVVRPMFVLLLAGFLIALTAGKSAGLSWLVWLPPFTPFLLLVNSPGSVTFGSQAILLGLLLAAAAAMVLLATRLLFVTSFASQIFVSTRTKPQPLV
jgi:ABC-2 type transport system permease protein